MDGEKGVFLGIGLVIGGTTVLLSVPQTTPAGALDWAAALSGPAAALAALGAAMASISYQRGQERRETDRHKKRVRMECAPVLLHIAERAINLAKRLGPNLARQYPGRGQVPTPTQCRLAFQHASLRIKDSDRSDIVEVWRNSSWAFDAVMAGDIANLRSFATLPDRMKSVEASAKRSHQLAKTRPLSSRLDLHLAEMEMAHAISECAQAIESGERIRNVALQLTGRPQLKLSDTDFAFTKCLQETD
ncbi:hypothetical protein [Pyruvatibacter sp.]